MRPRLSEETSREQDMHCPVLAGLWAEIDAARAEGERLRGLIEKCQKQ